MRLVQTKYLKAGDIIARDIMTYDGGILLRRDTRFREAFRCKLLERNIFEVYIDDEMSKGIDPEEILTSEVRERITGDIRCQFDRLRDSLVMDADMISEVASILVEQLEKKEMVLELEDLKTNDNYTYEHCIAVAILSNMVCNKLSIKNDIKEQIVMGALIHDIGKIIIPKDILNKPGDLTLEEYELMKTHAEVGYHMIKDNPQISAVTKLAVLCHHEREDGSGYPLGKGEELHISAKIVAACDLFHALISDRCYRQGLPLNEAVTIAQSHPINPTIRTVIENSLCYYPVGCIVKLSDGRLSIVEKNYGVDIKRPSVRIIDKVEGKFVSSYKVNLSEEPKLYIVGRYNESI